MPLKKKTRTSTAKNKKTFAFKENAIGSKAIPLVTALKENNRCLASALGKLYYTTVLASLSKPQ